MITHNIQKALSLLVIFVLSTATTLNAVVENYSLAQAQSDPYASGEVLVQFREGYSASSIDSTAQLNGML